MTSSPHVIIKSTKTLKEENMIQILTLRTINVREKHSILLFENNTTFEEIYLYKLLRVKLVSLQYRQG